MAAEHHPTPPRPHPADVMRALAAVSVRGSSAELERLVRAYVRALRTADVPPERALVRVKAAVGAPSVTPIPGHASTPLDRVGDDLVKWFVAEYYRAD
jgi:hypothetical protein